jgi:hypothetical protein
MRYKPAVSTRQRPRRLGIAFVTVVCLLLGWNVYAAIRNQLRFEPYDVPRVRPRSIERLLDQNVMPVVKHTFGLYRHMRLLAGKTVVLPRSWQGHLFGFERVGRVKVEFTDERHLLPIEVTDKLYPRVDRHWAVDSGTLFEVILDPAATRYVVVERDSGGLAILVSEAFFRQELAALSKTP